MHWSESGSEAFLQNVARMRSPGKLVNAGWPGEDYSRQTECFFIGNVNILARSNPKFDHVFLGNSVFWQAARRTYERALKLVSTPTWSSILCLTDRLSTLDQAIICLSSEVITDDWSIWHLRLCSIYKDNIQLVTTNNLINANYCCKLCSADRHSTYS